MIYRPFSVSKLLSYRKSEYDHTQLTADIEGNYYGMSFTKARITKMLGEDNLYELRVLPTGSYKFELVEMGIESLQNAKRTVLFNSVKREALLDLERKDTEFFFECHPNMRIERTL